MAGVTVAALRIALALDGSEVKAGATAAKTQIDKLAGVVGKLDDKFEEAGETLGEALGGGIAESLGDELRDVGRVADRVFDDLGDGAADALREVSGEAQVAADRFAGAFEGVGDQVSTGLSDGVRGIAGTLSEGLGDAARLGLDVFKDQARDGLVALGVDPELATDVARFAGRIGDTIATPLVGAVTNGISGLGENLAEKIASSGIGAAVSGVMGTVGTLAGSVMTAAMALAPLALPALLVAGIVAAIVLVANDPSLPKKALDVGVSIVGGIIGGLADLAGKVLDVVTGAVGGLIATGSSVLSGALDAGVAIVGQIIGGLVALPGMVLSTVVDAVRGLIEVGGQVATAAFEAGVAIVDQIVTGVVGVGSKIGQAIQDAIAAFGDIVFSLVPRIDPFVLDLGPLGKVAVTTAGVYGITPEPRAMGGPVTGGRPYVVGERGPELFVPGSGGSVMSNAGVMGSIGPREYVIHNHLYLDGQRVMDWIERQTARQQAIQNPIPITASGRR